MMYLDVKFFKNLIKMLETNHNMVRERKDVTEAWLFHVDQTLVQCKEIARSAEYKEERESLFRDYNEIVTQLEEMGWYPILKDQTYLNIEDLPDDEEQDE